MKLCFLLMQINTAQARVIKLVESTLRLSNLNIVTSVIFKGESSVPMPVTSVVRNDIIDPALSEVQVSPYQLCQECLIPYFRAFHLLYFCSVSFIDKFFFTKFELVIYSCVGRKCFRRMICFCTA